MPKTASRADRHAAVLSQDRHMLQWFVSKHAKSQQLSVFCVEKMCMVSVYGMYKMHLKNFGKKKFDISGTHEARSRFCDWFIRNDFDKYVHTHRHDIERAFKAHKRAIYQQYKTGVRIKVQAGALLVKDHVSSVRRGA